MRLFLASALAVALGAAPACNHTQSSSSDPSGRGSAKKKRAKRPKRQRGMPKALRLPKEPAAAVHVKNPRVFLATIAAYSDLENKRPRNLVRLGAALGGAGAFERKLSAFVDLKRPWDAAVVDGQTILHLPVAKPKLREVKQLLAGKPASGKFGAVDLQRKPESKNPKLAWLDEETSTITLADTLPGIATGRHLGRTYGKQPLFVTITPAQAKRFQLPTSAGRVTIKGDGAHDFTVVTEKVPEGIQGFDKLRDGALTGLLEAPQVAAGVSTKYSDYKQVVGRITNTATSQVNRQNFLVKGALEGLVKRFNALVRMWNGRAMVGVGPANHVLAGLGANEPGKANGAFLYLLGGALDTLKTARSFGVGGLPRFRHSKNKYTVGDAKVHIVVLENAARYISDPSLRKAIDSRGELRVVIAFSKRAGGAMVVAGPDSTKTMLSWLEQVGKTTPAGDSKGHLLSATLAVKPETLAPVAADPKRALGLTADRKPTNAVMTRRGDGLKIVVKGPRIRPPKRPPGAPKRTVPSRAAP